MIKIQIHSVVDLITNSSTTIFTYSEGSVEPLKELVNEILKLSGKTETFDDIFNVEVFFDDIYIYSESDYERDNFKSDDEYQQYLIDIEDINKTIDRIVKGEITKPKWMINYEESEGDYNDYRRTTSLYLYTKDPQYEELCNKITSFLYSTDHEAYYN